MTKSELPKRNRAALFAAILLGVLVISLLIIIVAQRRNYERQLTTAHEKAAAMRTFAQAGMPGGFPMAPKLSDEQLKQILAKAQPTGVSIDTSIRQNDPATMAMIRKGQSRGVQRLLGPLVDGLNLPKEQNQKLKSLLVDRKQAIDDARRTAFEQGLHDPRLVNQLEALATKESDDRIAQLLGPETAAKLQTRIDVADQYNSIQNYIGLDMAYAGVPLTQDQGIALASAMKDLHYSPIPLASQARITEMANPGVNVSQAILDRAAQILTAEQFEVFKANQAEKTKEESLRLAEVQSMKRTPSH